MRRPSNLARRVLSGAAALVLLTGASVALASSASADTTTTDTSSTAAGTSAGTSDGPSGTDAGSTPTTEPSAAPVPAPRSTPTTSPTATATGTPKAAPAPAARSGATKSDSASKPKGASAGQGASAPSKGSSTSTTATDPNDHPRYDYDFFCDYATVEVDNSSRTSSAVIIVYVNNKPVSGPTTVAAGEDYFVKISPLSDGDVLSVSSDGGPPKYHQTFTPTNCGVVAAHVDATWSDSCDAVTLTLTNYGDRTGRVVVRDSSGAQVGDIIAVPADGKPVVTTIANPTDGETYSLKYFNGYNIDEGRTHTYTKPSDCKAPANPQVDITVGCAIPTGGLIGDVPGAQVTISNTGGRSIRLSIYVDGSKYQGPGAYRPGKTSTLVIPLADGDHTVSVVKGLDGDTIATKTFTTACTTTTSTPPTVSATAQCAAPTGSAPSNGALVTVDNTQGTADASVTVTDESGTKTVIDVQAGKSVSQSIELAAGTHTLTFTEGTMALGSKDVTVDCSSTPPPTVGAVTATSTCSGVTVTLTNESSTAMTFTVSARGASRVFSVPAKSERKVSVTNIANGTVVSVKQGSMAQNFLFTKPASCTTGGGGSGGNPTVGGLAADRSPTLPQTGSNLALLVTAGLMMVLAGLVLTVAGRRFRRS